MSDISMCLNKNCPRKDRCYRYTAPGNPYGQSYSDFENYCPQDNYKYFWDNSGRDYKDNTNR